MLKLDRGGVPGVVGSGITASNDILSRNRELTGHVNRRHFLLVTGLASTWDLWRRDSAEARSDQDQHLEQRRQRRPSRSKYVAVRLFSAVIPLQDVTLLAPFRLEGEIFRTGVWRLHVHRGQLFLRGAGQPRRYHHAILLEQAYGIEVPHSEPRRYRGVIQIHPVGEQELEVINWVEREDYLLSVVPSEMPATWPTEALQAQAIIARTWAVQHEVKPAILTLPSQNPDLAKRILADSTADQFYGGLRYETQLTTAAVRATTDQILTYDQAPITAFFHSTCGGHTSAKQAIFGPPDHTYLQGVACPWCQASPFYGPHTVKISAADLVQIVGSRDLDVVVSDPYGRPLQIRVGSQVWSGQDFWLQLGQSIGWGILPSNRFEIEAHPDPQLIYHFTYRGAGHGVGLCQWGAKGQAEAGRSVDQILEHYYPGTTVAFS